MSTCRMTRGRAPSPALLVAASALVALDVVAQRRLLFLALALALRRRRRLVGLFGRLHLGAAEREPDHHAKAEVLIDSTAGCEPRIALVDRGAARVRSAEAVHRREVAPQVADPPELDQRVEPVSDHELRVDAVHRR